MTRSTATKKKTHATNGDVRESEEPSLTASSSSGSEPLPSNYEDSSSGVKSVAARVESSEEVEEDEVVKKKVSAKKRKKTGKAGDDEVDADVNVKCLFPMNRIKMIAKSEGGDDMRLSHEAIFLINKASENFLELFCEGAYAETVNENKNYVAYHHLSASVAKEQRLCFLSDLIPIKITAEEALRQKQLHNAAPTNN